MSVKTRKPEPELLHKSVQLNDYLFEELPSRQPRPANNSICFKFPSLPEPK